MEPGVIAILLCVLVMGLPLGLDNLPPNGGLKRISADISGSRDSHMPHSSSVDVSPDQNGEKQKGGGETRAVNR